MVEIELKSSSILSSLWKGANLSNWICSDKTLYWSANCWPLFCSRKRRKSLSDCIRFRFFVSFTKSLYTEKNVAKSLLSFNFFRYSIFSSTELFKSCRVWELLSLWWFRKMQVWFLLSLEFFVSSIQPSIFMWI